MRTPTIGKNLPFRPLINIKQVSELTGNAVSITMTKHCKNSHAYDPGFPRPLKCDARIGRYNRNELHAWIEGVAAKRTRGVAL